MANMIENRGYGRDAEWVEVDLDGNRLTYPFPTKRDLLEAIEGFYAYPGGFPEPHDLRVDRTTLGCVWGSNTPNRGVHGRCACGNWDRRVNEAPSKGGTRSVTELWVEHLRDVWANPPAAPAPSDLDMFRSVGAARLQAAR